MQVVQGKSSMANWIKTIVFKSQLHCLISEGFSKSYYVKFLKIASANHKSKGIFHFIVMALKLETTNDKNRVFTSTCKLYTTSIWNMYTTNVINTMAWISTNRLILHHIFIFELCYYARKPLRICREMNSGIQFLQTGWELAHRKLGKFYVAWW